MKKSNPFNIPGGGINLQLFALAYNEVDNPYEFSLIAHTWVKGTNKSTIVYNLVNYYKNIPNHTTIEELPEDNATYIKNALPNVNDCSCMLGNKETDGCNSLTSINSTDWDVSNIKNMSSMFGNCRSLTTLDVSKWDTSKVTNMNNMFVDCSALTNLDVSKWNTSKVTDMSYMFYGCYALTTLDVSKWNTSKVTYMGSMFYYCSTLTTLDVSNWDTSNVTNMGSMFVDCIALTTLDVSKWDTSNVTDMGGMFCGCNSLTTITGVIDMKSCDSYNCNRMFSNCPNITGVKIKNPPSGFTDTYASEISSGKIVIVQ